ncbi:hypothetical protein A6R68_22999, partial [Neotoma lepida]
LSPPPSQQCLVMISLRKNSREKGISREPLPHKGSGQGIIRVQSPDGVKRITTTKRETAAAFLKKVAKEFGFQNNGFSVYINRNKTGEITASSSKSLHLLKIK